MRLQPHEYYVHDFTEHTSQGDVYGEVPFVWTTMAKSADERPAGTRPRPADPQPFPTEYSMSGFGIVCNYTCGFVAQPPGTRGYAHPYRLVAPIFPLRVYAETLQDSGLSVDSVRSIIGKGGANGFMYLPGEMLFPEDDSEWAGHAAAYLYRMSAVTQSVLDDRRRVARLSANAQRVFTSRLAQVVSPYWVEPFGSDSTEPDRSDSWNLEAPSH